MNNYTLTNDEKSRFNCFFDTVWHRLKLFWFCVQWWNSDLCVLQSKGKHILLNLNCCFFLFPRATLCLYGTLRSQCRHCDHFSKCSLNDKTHDVDIKSKTHQLKWKFNFDFRFINEKMFDENVSNFTKTRNITRKWGYVWFRNIWQMRQWLNSLLATMFNAWNFTKKENSQLTQNILKNLT